MEEIMLLQPSNNNEEKPKKTFWQKTKQHAKYKYVEASEKRKARKYQESEQRMQHKALERRVYQEEVAKR